MARKKTVTGNLDNVAYLPKDVQGRLEISDPDLLQNLRRGEDVIKVCLFRMRKKLEETRDTAIEARDKINKTQQQLSREEAAACEARAHKYFSRVKDLAKQLASAAKIPPSKVEMRLETHFRSWLSRGDWAAMIPVDISMRLQSPHSGCSFDLEMKPVKREKEAAKQYQRLEAASREQQEIANKAQRSLANMNSYREEFEAVLAAKRLESDESGAQVVEILESVMTASIKRLTNR